QQVRGADGQAAGVPEGGHRRGGRTGRPGVSGGGRLRRGRRPGDRARPRAVADPRHAAALRGRPRDDGEHTMIAELRTSLRLRRLTLPELIEEAERSGACTATGRPPVTAVLIMRRLLSGFGTSMDET